MKVSKEKLRKEYENLVKKNTSKKLPSISYFDFLEEKILKPTKEKVTDGELEYPNLTCLVYGYELTTYQRLLAKKEYKKLIELKVSND